MDGLCCVLEEDPMLRTGALVSSTTYMLTKLLDFTIR